jgi:hypothetical protein
LKPRNSLFDPWIDVELMAEHTSKINSFIVLACLLLALLIVSRSRLFDNWGSGVVLVVLSCYLLWATAMAAILNLSERARSTALDEMEADLQWLQGAGPAWKGLAEPLAPR